MTAFPIFPLFQGHGILHLASWDYTACGDIHYSSIARNSSSDTMGTPRL